MRFTSLFAIVCALTAVQAAVFDRPVGDNSLLRRGEVENKGHGGDWNTWYSCFFLCLSLIPWLTSCFAARPSALDPSIR